MYIDREQALQLKRAGAYGYQWAVKNRHELTGFEGRPEVCEYLAGHVGFVVGLPRPFGWDRVSRMVQRGRCHRAAVAGVLRALGRMGVKLLPY